MAASSGVLSGTPTTAAGYTFVIRVTDANGQTSNTGSLTPTIYAMPALSGTLPAGSTGVAYNQTLARTGGKTPFTYSISVGALPAGLSINTSTGAITGTPTTAGANTFTVRVIDTLGNSATSAQSVTIVSQLTLTGTLNPTVILGSAYSSSLTASNGTPAYTFDISVGVLPTGLSINASTGVISGTTNDATTRNFTVRVTDAASNTATSAQSLTPAAALAWSVGYTATGAAGVAYSSTPTVTGGVTPYVYSLLSGPLPTGLSLNTSTGAITGTPTTGGSYPFTIRVTDANSSSADRSTTLVISQALAWTANAYDNVGTLTVAYSSSPGTVGGVAPIVYSVFSGALPNGLSLNTATGAVTGTPTVNAIFSFTIRATDALGATADKARPSLVVATYPLLNGTYAAGTRGAAYSSQLYGSGGHATYGFSKIGGTLPPGLTFNNGTCELAGTPTTAGAYTFTIRLQDQAGNVADSAQSVTIT